MRNRISEHRTTGWGEVRSDIFFREDLAPALEGIEGFSHVLVVFHLHAVSEDDRRLLTLPLPGEIGGEIGLFATRIAVRPNGIGVAAVPIVWRRKNVLRVRGLDALDGTPVLDIKPYVPAYDSVPGARMPAWAEQAAQR